MTTRQGARMSGATCGIDKANTRTSRSLSSGANSRDPLAMLLRMRSETLMVRSASSRQRSRCPARVSNHEATAKAAMI